MSESTVQIRVGPGEQTQLYHVPLANLPFRTGRQQLKDWIHSVCEVDHIEVFPKSTSAWVRLRGEENFNKAWGLINGDTFNGRALVADDKNKTQSIMIKVTIYSPQPPYSEAATSQYCLENRYAHPYAAIYTKQSSAIQHYCYQPPMTTAASISATYALAVPREWYASSDYSNGVTSYMGQPRGAYTPQSQGGEFQYALPYHDSPHYSHEIVSCVTESQVSQHGAPQPSNTATEPRKVVVTGFSQQGEYDEIMQWIRRRVGTAHNIISIEIPMNGSSNYLRGHAFIVFETADGAIQGIDLLGRSKFNSRRVTARLTSEGVVPGEYEAETHKVKSSRSRRPERTHFQDEPVAEPSQLADDQPYGSRREKKLGKKSEKRLEKKSDKSSSSSSSKKRSSSDKKQDMRYNAPVVVNGSSLPKDRY